MRIAMWSGPRNLSTAMMYSFAARDDCTVWDEPYYAAYLSSTGLEHPMRAEILAAGEQNAECVAAHCLEKGSDNKPNSYLKLMTQHMLPEFDRSWMSGVTNVFLIRHPAKVMASYLAKRESSTINDIGFWQQEALFRRVTDATGEPPVVIDSEDILSDPAKALQSLCKSIGLPFQDRMLRWSKGPHKYDGVWAPHWYKSVWQSTGFTKKRLSEPSTTGLDANILGEALKNYEFLRKYRI